MKLFHIGVHHTTCEGSCFLHHIQSVKYSIDMKNDCDLLAFCCINKTWFVSEKQQLQTRQMMPQANILACL